MGGVKDKGSSGAEDAAPPFSPNDTICSGVPTPRLSPSLQFPTRVPTGLPVPEFIISCVVWLRACAERSALRNEFLFRVAGNSDLMRGWRAGELGLIDMSDGDELTVAHVLKIYIRELRDGPLIPAPLRTAFVQSLAGTNGIVPPRRVTPKFDEEFANSESAEFADDEERSPLGEQIRIILSRSRNRLILTSRREYAISLFPRFSTIS